MICEEISLEAGMADVFFRALSKPKSNVITPKTHYPWSPDYARKPGESQLGAQ